MSYNNTRLRGIHNYPPAKRRIIEISEAKIIMDYDSNEYHSITIGTQQWLVENLRTTHYADGTPIPNLTLDADWQVEDGTPGHDGAMCWYDNDIANKAIYGALYNWHAINNVFDDWFLPSKDELNEMYLVLKLYDIGGLTDDYFWSSSENDAITTWIQNFRIIDTLQNVIGKESTCAVRACRKFTTTTVYALRDSGPAGGWIFYKNGNDYLECAPTNQSASITWSNITNIAIGITDTAIGTGQANTTAIIGQVGHTDSAAKRCDDIVTYVDKLAVGQFTKWGSPSIGWRVPTQTDFETLSTLLGGDAIVGGKLKEIGLTHWLTPNTGATDEFGFKAIPTGFRYDIGAFNVVVNSSGLWWTATEFNSTIGQYKSMTYNDSIFYDGASNKTYGFAVRCMRDLV